MLIRTPRTIEFPRLGSVVQIVVMKRMNSLKTLGEETCNMEFEPKIVFFAPDSVAKLCSANWALTEGEELKP